MMSRKIVAMLIKRFRDESGQALLVVLALLMVGGLTLPPLLSQIGTAFKTGKVYDIKTREFYAADSGIEDAIWQIKYDRLGVLFADSEYDIYDFYTTWSYGLDEQINGLAVDVDVQNVWIPKDVTPLSAAQGRNIIESNKLMVAGSAIDATSYKIKIGFTPETGEEDNLLVESIGIWLPLGFTYVPESSNLEEDENDEYYAVPDVEDYAGGQAIIWELNSVPFIDFPGVDSEVSPMVTEITFNYSSNPPGISPVAIAWITTSGVNDIPISWDVDTRIYKIVSAADGTEIEAYSAKCELRKMGAAIAGDYRAVGNSLMIDSYWDWYGIRDQLLSQSTAEVSDIPASADVVAAYLYWSGWFADADEQPIFEDDCADLGEWISGSNWNINTGRFRSHYNSGEESTRYNTLKDSIDLSLFQPDMVKVGWQQSEDGSLESDDGLKFQFSGDDGLTWSSMITAFSNDIGSTPESFSYTIPGEYLTGQFKFRFYLQGFTGSDDNYLYVDNFTVTNSVFTADTSVVFKINGTQVYLDTQGEPQAGSVELTAGEYATLENQPDEYSYACKRDVTQLVKTYSDLGDNENRTGNGTYTVGGVDADTGEHWSYAGWSLIIVYSSPETAGHQLYLYDTFAFNHGNENLDFDNDGQPGGAIKGFLVPEPISGELNAVSLTCFVGEGDTCFTGDYLRFNGTNLSDGAGSVTNVWDSQSIGLSEDGVDIDTFYVTWASGLVEPGDTTAQLDMPSNTDNWNLIYIILSLRSETVTGGTTHYTIHKK